MEDMERKISGVGSVPQRRLTKDWGNVIDAPSAVDKITHLKAPTDHIGFVQVEKGKCRFCTGSSYEGKHNALGFDGFGTYTFPHGAQYLGYFVDGQFDGEGTIIYPKGAQIDGNWLRGKLISWSYRYADGLELSKHWTYCQFPDRIFRIELSEGLQPAGSERLCNGKRHKIPEDTFDTVDGYFDAKTKVVWDYKRNKVLRIPTEEEEIYMREHYWENRDRPVGYRPDLYEYFTMGTEEDVMKIEAENTEHFSEESIATYHTESSEILREARCLYCTFTPRKVIEDTSSKDELF